MSGYFWLYIYLNVRIFLIIYQNVGIFILTWMSRYFWLYVYSYLNVGLFLIIYLNVGIFLIICIPECKNISDYSIYLNVVIFLIIYSTWMSEDFWFYTWMSGYFWFYSWMSGYFWFYTWMSGYFCMTAPVLRSSICRGPTGFTAWTSSRRPPGWTESRQTASATPYSRFRLHFLVPETWQ